MAWLLSTGLALDFVSSFKVVRAFGNIHLPFRVITSCEGI